MAEKWAIGLMSGTSADGVDAALIRGDAGHIGSFGPALLAPYDADFRRRLTALYGGKAPAEEIASVELDLTERHAAAVLNLLERAGMQPRDIAVIGFHGQTIFHAPHERRTWQIGDGALLAQLTGIDVVNDFRSADVAAGGQGAPLVPIADALLFAGPSWRALQNIGGIGNVTIVPPLGGVDGTRAFDTGPGVAIIDGVVRALRPDLPYDVDGQLAARGAAITSVVDAALSHPYFSAPPPKSTGRELFTPAYVADFIAKCRAAHASCTDEDIIATAVELTARSIRDAFERFVPEPVDDLLISGGGARNPALARRIEALMAPRTVRQFDALYFDGDAKEAVAFAFLGWLHLMGFAGNVPACTGASGPRVLGTYTPA